MGGGGGGLEGKRKERKFERESEVAIVVDGWSFFSLWMGILLALLFWYLVSMILSHYLLSSPLYFFSLRI